MKEYYKNFECWDSLTSGLSNTRLNRLPALKLHRTKGGRSFHIVMLPSVDSDELRKRRRRRDSEGTNGIKHNSTAKCRSSWWIKLLGSGGVTVQSYTWRVAHIHTIHTQVSQAWTYEARHGSHMTVVTWKLWVRMHLQRRRLHLVCLRRCPGQENSCRIFLYLSQLQGAKQK